MKKVCGLFLCLVFVVSGFSTPLVFKAEKILTGKKMEEVAVFDASKYKQIRIVVTNPIDYLDKRSNIKVYVLGEEDGTRFLLNEDSTTGDYSTTIDSPPAKIKIQVGSDIEGITKVFIYGQ